MSDGLMHHPHVVPMWLWVWFSLIVIHCDVIRGMMSWGYDNDLSSHRQTVPHTTKTAVLQIQRGCIFHWSARLRIQHRGSWEDPQGHIWYWSKNEQCQVSKVCVWDMEDPSSNPPRSGFPNYTLFAVQSFVYNSNPSENQTTSFTNTDPKNNACMKSDNP